MSHIARLDTKELIKAIDAYAARKGISPQTVTRRAVGASQLYKRMKNGGGCTLAVANRLRKFVEADKQDAA